MTTPQQSRQSLEEQIARQQRQIDDQQQQINELRLQHQQIASRQQQARVYDEYAQRSPDDI